MTSIKTNIGVNQPAISSTTTSSVVHRRRTARRAINRSLVNCCCTDCMNKLYDKSTTNRSNNSRALRSTDVYKNCERGQGITSTSSNGAATDESVVNKLDSRQSFVNTTNRLAVAKFSKSSVWDKVIFGVLHKAQWDRWMEAPLPKTPARPVQSFRCNASL